MPPEPRFSASCELLMKPLRMVTSGARMPHCVPFTANTAAQLFAIASCSVRREGSQSLLIHFLRFCYFRGQYCPLCSVCTAQAAASAAKAVACAVPAIASV
ncbi:MAG: hypothetical protein FWF61_04795, partial [Brevinematales bacterium]|nr:hypothetical protein [Brevinematales bacterium]